MGSLHFSDSEIACKCCGSGADLVSPILLEMLEQLRSDCGNIPLTLNCVYRCPSHNAEVGGVPNSQHVLGEAADIAVPASMTTAEFLAKVEACRDWQGHRFTGIGCYAYDSSCNSYGDGFIHADVRGDGWADDDDVARWWDLG